MERAHAGLRPAGLRIVLEGLPEGDADGKGKHQSDRDQKAAGAPRPAPAARPGALDHGS
jgi:hypothetical protein